MAGKTLQCSVCKNIHIVPEEKAAGVTCRTCAAAMVPLGDEKQKAEGGTQKAEELPGAAEGSATAAAVVAYTPEEFKASAKSGVWNVERLLLTVKELGRQIAALGQAGVQQAQELAVCRNALAVLLCRLGGTATVREAEIKRLHPEFAIAVEELPPNEKGKVIAVGYREPAPTIQVVGAIPPGLNGRPKADGRR